MPQSVTSWTTNWDYHQSFQTMYDEIHEKAVGGAIAGAWAGGVMGGPGGLVGGAASGAAGGIVVGFFSGLNHAINDVLTGTANGQYTWERHDSMQFLPTSTPSLTPLGAHNESDGSVTHSFRLYDGTTMAMNTAQSIMRLTGTVKADEFVGMSGRDYYNGGAGNDIIKGKDGADTLSGSIGADWLYGGGGNDRLTGGNGIDRVWGGEGADTFVFAKTVTDRDLAYFDLAQDKVAGTGFHATSFDYDTDSRGVHRITDIYLTGGNHLALQQGDGDDGRYGMGYSVWSVATLDKFLHDQDILI